MSSPDFESYDRVQAVFEQVLAASPADETELVWFERRHGVARHPETEGGLDRPRQTLLVRVVEGGRQGWHRTEILDANLVESGVRQALALAKLQPKLKKRPLLPTDVARIRSPGRLLDPAVQELRSGSARERLAGWCGNDARARLRWSETRLAVWNSHGLRRRAASTEVSLEVVAGEGSGAGRAAGSARDLETLAGEEICRRAREAQAPGEAGDLPLGPRPVVLAPEAVIELINLLNSFALSSRAYLDGTSLLSRHRNVQVFDRSFHLRDDGTQTPGLPFPFDLEGSPKRPLDLIVEGRPSTPALNSYQGVRAGLEPTAQAVGGQDSLFGNLFLLPGGATEEDLLAAADGGLYVGWLDTPECYDPTQLHFRARARSVRRIEGGRLGGPLPDLVWEESLLRAFARLRAIGRRARVRSVSSTPLGAVSAPALALTESDGLGRPMRYTDPPVSKEGSR